MAVEADFIECLGVNQDAVDFSPFFGLLLGFLEFAPKLVTVDGLTLDVIPNIGNLPTLLLGSYAAKIPAPIGSLEIPDAQFDPGKLVGKFVPGFLDLALGIPEIFGLSLKIGDYADPANLPVPKIPDFDAILGLVILSFGLGPPGIPDAEFARTFAQCVAEALAGVILP